ncbi:BrnA antitoxin family protein [uncultured Litoreibacter sp.]|uniref:BrnA antitoxin family protein n=1 Tax=uncultured Litoreibacter sp. TaxID=1392394 RepID=UPI00260D48CA|nr:BrnA antitoxin family protein [uncultured Litoreibacter sp.]
MGQKTVRAQMSTRQKRHHYFLIDLMRELTYDLHHQLEAGIFALPPEWQEIADRKDSPGKERMTIRIDRDVAKFFRSTGQGFQTRMNDVLRAFMHARLSGMIEDGSRYETYVDGGDYERRPAVGDFERDVAQVTRRERE